MRPIDYLLGNINPNTGLPINALVKDQNFPRPVKIDAMPSLLGVNNSLISPMYNQNIQSRDGSVIPVRQMTNVGSLPQDRRTPSLLTPNVGAINQDNTATGLLGASFRDPRTVGALNASSELLKLGGASVGKPAPTLGQGLGFATQAYLKGMQGQEDRIAKQQMAGLKSQLDLANYINKVQEMQLGIQKSKKDDLKTKFTQEKDLRKEFTAIAKPFRETITNFNKAFAFASKKNPTGASDIALVFAYMKALDPRSVVRENEQADVQNAGGTPAYVRNAWNKISTGQRFDPQVRKDILDASKSLVLGQIQTQRDLENEYKKYAENNNLNVDNVFTSLLPKVGTFLNPLPVATMEEAEEKLKDGQYFTINGQIGVID